MRTLCWPCRTAGKGNWRRAFPWAPARRCTTALTLSRSGAAAAAPERDRVNAVVQRLAGAHGKARLQFPFPAVRQGQHKVRMAEKLFDKRFLLIRQPIIKGQILRAVDMHDGRLPPPLDLAQIQGLSERAAPLRCMNVEQVVLFPAEQKPQIRGA